MISGILIHKASVFTFSLHGPEKLQGIRAKVAFMINYVHRVDFIPQSDSLLQKSLGWHMGRACFVTAWGQTAPQWQNCFLMWHKHIRAKAGRDK